MKRLLIGAGMLAGLGWLVVRILWPGGRHEIVI